MQLKKRRDKNDRRWNQIEGQTRHFKNDSEKRLPRVFTIRLIRCQSKLTTKTEFARFTWHKKPLYKNNLVIRNGVQAVTASLKYV